MQDLALAAEALGLEAEGASGNYEALMKEPMPCIAHVVTEGFLQHFVVLYHVSRRTIVVGDPAKGVLTLSRRQFEEMWRSKVVLRIRSRSPMKSPEETSLASWIVDHMRGSSPWVVQTIFLGFVTTCLGLFAASSVQIVLDRLIPERRFTGIVTVALLLALIVTAKAVLGYVRQKFIVVAGRSIAERMAREFLQRLFRLPKEFFVRRRAGDITSRFGDAVKVQQAILRLLSAVFLDSFVLVGSLAILARLSIPLFLCTLCVIPLFVFLMLHHTRDISTRNHEVLGAYARVESAYIDALNGIDEILNKNGGEYFARSSMDRFSLFQRGLLDLGFVQARLSFIAELCANLLSFTLLATGSYLVASGSLKVGEMMAAFSLSAFAFPSVLRIVEASVQYNSASIAVQRMRDLVQSETERDAGHRAFVLPALLEIHDGTFSWNRGSTLLDGVSLALPRGTLTGLWGPSGSGKSTIAEIFMRKVPLTAGSLLVDGVPAEEFSLQWYRERIALVPQEPTVFHATLMENIVLGYSGVRTAELAGIVRSLQLEGFFDRFRDGPGTMVGEEGVQLSWGERQIVCLLRALVRNPDVLIVDEGLSGLDDGLADGVMGFLHGYARDHAVLMITHDRDVIAQADRAYMLSGGTVSPARTGPGTGVRIAPFGE